MTDASQSSPSRRPIAVLSIGFRPFFLGAGLWALVSMGIWLGMLTGRIDIPTALDPVAWHAHAFLFGYLSAVAAGFLLTAVPNWTGRAPMSGMPLAALFALWMVGRIAVLGVLDLTAGLMGLIDLAFLATLAGLIAREIVLSKNWRNLMIVALLLLLLVSNAFFHWEAAAGGDPAHGIGLRLGLSAALMMIAVIGGRIVPAFTKNWLVKRGVTTSLPAPTMQKFDIAALLGFLLALIAWSIAPFAQLSGGLLCLAGVLHLVRLARWSGTQTLSEPLVWILHLGYLFLPLGALALGLAILLPDLLQPAAAQHLWMVGGIGVMTLAVMTRATLGHSGRKLTASRGTTAIYLLVLLAVLSRISAGFAPQYGDLLHQISGVSWSVGFAAFCVIYGPLCLRRRRPRG